MKIGHGNINTAALPCHAASTSAALLMTSSSIKDAASAMMPIWALQREARRGVRLHLAGFWPHAEKFPRAHCAVSLARISRWQASHTRTGLADDGSGICAG